MSEWTFCETHLTQNEVADLLVQLQSLQMAQFPMWARGSDPHSGHPAYTWPRQWSLE